MKKLLPLLLLILIGCSGQDRYEMKNSTTRIDKKNGEYEQKICGTWYMYSEIEYKELSENDQKKISTSLTVDGERNIKNGTRKFVSITFEYKHLISRITSFSDLNPQYEIRTSYISLCPGESYLVSYEFNNGFKIIKLSGFSTGWFNS